MSKVIATFFASLLVTFAAVFLLSEYVFMPAFFDGALEAARPSADVDIVRDGSFPRDVIRILCFKIAVVGALICACFSAMRVANETTSVGRHRTASSSGVDQSTVDALLSSTEFDRVRQCCFVLPLEGKDPLFIHGLIVGRMAESSPELAAKIAKFSETHVRAMLQDLKESDL